LKAVILVGGEGTRLRPLTYDIPKSMLPIMEKPFMEHLLNLLRKHGICEVIFAAGYKSQVFIDHFSDGSSWGMKLHHIIEDNPLGTAGGVKNAESFIDDTFLVFNGDILTDMDLAALVDAHRKKKAFGTIALTPVENPTIYGVVETMEDGRIIKFKEKPQFEEITTNLINAGVYVLEPEILSRIPLGEKYSFEKQLFPSLLDEEMLMYSWETSSYWIDIGSPEKYLKVHHDILLDNIKLELKTSNKSEDSVWMEEGVKLEGGVKINPPVFIGERSEIKSGASVGPLTVIGKNCTIEENATVKGSILWKGTFIGANSRLDNCIVGGECIVGNECSIHKLAIIQSGAKLSPGLSIQPETHILTK